WAVGVAPSGWPSSELQEMQRQMAARSRQAAPSGSRRYGQQLMSRGQRGLRSAAQSFRSGGGDVFMTEVPTARFQSDIGGGEEKDFCKAQAEVAAILQRARTNLAPKYQRDGEPAILGGGWQQQRQLESQQQRQPQRKLVSACINQSSGQGPLPQASVTQGTQTPKQADVGKPWRSPLRGPVIV
uniref:TORC_N domain-containing protein n=1 Tax=Macrostomum lignano TaxID=282301 RepID=A0A1I8FGD0_9PLAT